ncbi:S1C family serine protease [uncultured Streptomyces sp.]|uniref:S1C family serine protease n=1 Tax=uncultured Streptomyces sp. TaxID=174707 RepID=UPI00261E1F2F|nr:trypsin-like peptidase domain-containing protein [uncultured Streptomyces sp.]
MDDGKPTGPRAKWWSRPAGGPDRSGRGDAMAPAPQPEAEAPQPRAEAPQPQADAQALAPQAPAVDPAAPEPVPAAAHAPRTEIPAAQAPAAAEALAAQPPAAAQTLAAQPPAAAHAPASVAPGTGPAPHPRPVPLHEPDEYSTPPYGGPGPWAPAPPVQRPVPTPPHGIPLPAASTPPYVPRQAGTEHPAPQPAPAAWHRYDPWGTPRHPLTGTGTGTDRPRRSRRGSRTAGAVLLALVAGCVGGGIGSYLERNGGVGTAVELPQAPAQAGDRAPGSVAGIAAATLPGVVTLHVSGGSESGTGTGFVLDARGHILTNHHVVAPAGSSGDITVTFSGGETASAEVVGTDSGYDLAVVKVDRVSGLRPLPLGNSDGVRVGDPVVAIGAPFDLSNTVTSGIISATERPITAGGEDGGAGDVSYVDALQTDAPINPGNSGGPLVDAGGRVIGVNSAIRAADSVGALGGQSGSIGLGFAIPINQGKRVAEELINTGHATHPVIGVTLDMKFTGDGAKVRDGETDDGGAPVTRGGPGDEAGIEPGDVVTAVDGARVHSGEELIVKIRAHRPGDRLRLRVDRGGRELSLTVTLGTSTGG